MSETNNYQTAVIHLKTVSPIHIRGKNIDFGEGMIRLNRKDDKLGKEYAYLIDNDVLCEWLYQLSSDNFKYVNAYNEFFTETRSDQNFNKRYPGKTDDRQLKKRYKEYSLELFFEDNNLLKKLESIKKDSKWYKVFKGRAFIGNRNYFIQNRKGRYYIPGSTFKGAIRTAILYSIIREVKNNNPDWFCKNVVVPVFHKIKKFIDIRSPRIKEVFAEKIENEVFKKCAPYDSNLKEKKGNTNSEQKDLMRIFHITDIPLDGKHLTKEEVMVMTLKNRNEPYKKQKFQDNSKIECHESEDVLRGRISIDLDLLKRFKEGFDNAGLPFSFPFDLHNPISSIEQMLQEFANDQWAEEVKYYNDVGRLIDSELDDSFKRRPYSCMEYGTVSNPRENLYFTNRENGAFINDKDILHCDKPIVKTNGRKVIFQMGTDSQGRLKAENPFSYRYDRNSQFSNSHNSLGTSFINPIKDFYSSNEKQANIRFGWGTQLLGMTIDLLFDPILRKLIRDEVLLRNLRNLPAPKSRRFVLKDDKAYKPLGWCKVTFQEDR